MPVLPLPMSVNGLSKKQHNVDEGEASRRKNTVGRRGDPRMHNAVAIRQKHPEISLTRALALGGFDVTGETEADALTKLSQRKNQLSRRLRLLRHSKRSGGGEDNKNGQRRGSSRDKNASSKKLKMDNVAKSGNASSSFDDISAVTSPHNNSWATTYESFAQVNRAPSRNFDDNRHTAYEYKNSYDKAPKSYNPVNVELSLSSEQDRLALRPVNESQYNQSYQFPFIGNSAQSGYYHFGRSGFSNTTTSEKVNQALNMYRAESSSLLKRCMLNAGFGLRETEECDPAYIAFSSTVNKTEASRIARLRSMFANNDTLTSQQKVQHLGDIPDQHANKYIEKSGSIIDKVANTEFLSNPTNTDSDSNKNNLNMGNQECSDDHDHDAKEPHADCHKEGSSDVPTEHNEHCNVNGKHAHHLNGSCGHKPIIHKPKDGPAHVDFMVNGKVECYEKFYPSIPSDSTEIMWPSKFSCAELKCEHKRIGECVDEVRNPMKTLIRFIFLIFHFLVRHR